jgi:hypothetical protein
MGGIKCGHCGLTLRASEVLEMIGDVTGVRESVDKGMAAIANMFGLKCPGCKKTGCWKSN